MVAASAVVLLPNILADIVLFRYLAGLIAVIALVAGGVRMAFGSGAASILTNFRVNLGIV